MNLGSGGNFGNDIFGILGNFGISGNAGNSGNSGNSVGIDETISPTAPVTLSIASDAASVTSPMASFAVLPTSRDGCGSYAAVDGRQRQDESR